VTTISTNGLYNEISVPAASCASANCKAGLTFTIAISNAYNPNITQTTYTNFLVYIISPNNNIIALSNVT
jgi:hypothetical protein